MELVGHGPVIPLVGMLIDRSSFDETDDFHIDREALESTEWSKDILEGQQGSRPIVLKNGKVRRRLRWRPRKILKRQRRGSDDHICNASIASHSSKNSKRSVHSFASTETMQLSNTRASKLFPRSAVKTNLPRPNYPDHFSGVSTIGTEADMVYARMAVEKGRNKAPLEGTDVIRVKELQKKEFDPYQSPLHPTSTASPPKKGVPPLFQAAKKNSGRMYTLQELPEEQETPSPSPSIESDVTPVTAASTESGGTNRPEMSPPLPTLSGDEVERDRRVDLRIPLSQTSKSSKERFNSESKIKKESASRADVSIAELRNAPKSPQQQTIITSYSSPAEVMYREERSDNSDLRPSQSEPYSDTDTDDEDDDFFGAPFNASRPSTAALRELRFSMADRLDHSWRQDRLDSCEVFVQEGATDDALRTLTSIQETEDAKDEQRPSSPEKSVGDNTSKTRTGPVDLDNGTFLEVEKNLQAIHDMATEHLEQGEYDEALEVFEEILRGQLARYGESHYRVGTAHHNIGIVHARRGDYINAIFSYREAIRIRKKTLGPEHADVGVSLAQLGVAYLEVRRHKKALQAFRQSLKIRRRFYGNRHPKVAKILNNIGCALYELDELDVAKVAFEEALIIQRSLLKNKPPDNSEMSDGQLLGIASTRCNLASIKLIHGQYEEAMVDLEEALLIQQCVLPEDHPAVKRTRESLVWLETSNSASTGLTCGMGPGIFAGKLMGKSPIGQAIDDSMDHYILDGPISKSGLPLLLDALERKFNALRANLDSACGARDSSDDEDGGRLEIASF